MGILQRLLWQFFGFPNPTDTTKGLRNAHRKLGAHVGDDAQNWICEPAVGDISAWDASWSNATNAFKCGHRPSGLRPCVRETGPGRIFATSLPSRGRWLEELALQPLCEGQENMARDQPEMSCSLRCFEMLKCYVTGAIDYVRKLTWIIKNVWDFMRSFLHVISTNFDDRKS